MRKWITIIEANQEYNVSKQTLYSWIKRNKISFKKSNGNATKINLEELKARLSIPEKKEQIKNIKEKSETNVKRLKNLHIEELKKIQEKKQDQEIKLDEIELSFVKKASGKTRVELEDMFLEEKIAKIHRENKHGDEKTILKDKAYLAFNIPFLQYHNMEKEMLEKIGISYNFTSSQMENLKKKAKKNYEKFQAVMKKKIYLSKRT